MNESVVKGRATVRPLPEFEILCEVHITGEMCRAWPDKGLIDVLSDAVRLCRQYEDLQAGITELTNALQASERLLEDARSAEPRAFINEDLA